MSHYQVMERRDSQLLDVEQSQFMETKWIIVSRVLSCGKIIMNPSHLVKDMILSQNRSMNYYRISF